MLSNILSKTNFSCIFITKQQLEEKQTKIILMKQHNNSLKVSTETASKSEAEITLKYIQNLL